MSRAVRSGRRLTWEVSVLHNGWPVWTVPFASLSTGFGSGTPPRRSVPWSGTKTREQDRVQAAGITNRLGVEVVTGGLAATLVGVQRGRRRGIA